MKNSLKQSFGSDPNGASLETLTGDAAWLLVCMRRSARFILDYKR